MNNLQQNGILSLPSEYFPSIPVPVRTEVLRKSIHMLVALVPFAASLNPGITLALLAAGTIVYTYAELLRCMGVRVVLISRLTAMASRERDLGRFVLGPVTLGIGTMLALLLYPAPAASIAIFALAFGDGLASLVGKLFGRIRIPHTGGKTITGSAACFAAIFISARVVGASAETALAVAFVSTLVEMLPLKDLDNILLPLTAGTTAALFAYMQI
ncbi:phosphatidate cytidylyltransferase [Marispirochaeta aestuarii]|uniref:diacylglycerol/polyprenol kinase family protein n=2 Tax=Marispirochaeta aestuarii TaxID=1963862 RepID=UPI002ABDBAB4|nr:phosphatidate cytidylyltransferase [Marispirochaeta aestuarii]